jgi:hypothetical protein
MQSADEGGVFGYNVQTVGKEKMVHTEDTILCCLKDMLSIRSSVRHCLTFKGHQMAPASHTSRPGVQSLADQ